MEQNMTYEPEVIRRLKAECAAPCSGAGWDTRARHAEIEAFRRKLNATVGADVVRCFQIVPSFNLGGLSDEGRTVALLLNRHLPVHAQIDPAAGSGFYVSSYDIYGRALRNSEGELAERVRYSSLGQALLAAEMEFRRLEQRQASLMGRQATDSQIGTMPEEIWLREQLGRWVRIEPEIPPAPGVFPTAAELRRFLAEQRELLSPGFDKDVDRQLAGMDSGRDWRK
jgi:hypothetical protein